eukprot:g28576.t1
MVSKGRVVISAIGPYALCGEAVVEACVKNSTHYVDITGEVPWMYQMVQKYHARAEELKTKIVLSAGNVCAPDEILCYSLVRTLGPLKDYREYFSQFGGISGGTLQTNITSLCSDEDGQIIAKDPFCLGGRGSKDRPEDLDCDQVEADSLYPSELRVVIREGHLQRGMAEQQLQSFSTPKKEAADALLQARERDQAPWPGFGPPKELRKLYGAEIIALAQAESGHWAYARWTSGCAYEVSAMCAVCGALVLAEEAGGAGGVLTPAFAFHGTTWIDRLQEVPFANRGGQKIALEIHEGKPTEEILRAQISERNRRVMIGFLDGRDRIQGLNVIGFAFGRFFCVCFGSWSSRGPGASVKVKPGVAREDPAPAKIPSSQSFSLASGAGANSPLPSRSGSMQLPVRSHTPRDHWQASFAVPAAPPPSPVPGRCEMPLAVRRFGKQVYASQETLEAYQLADDDLGRLVRFTFTHVCGPNGGTVLGLGFGTADARMEEESLDLCEPSSGSCEEESITAMYDATQGLLRFTVESRRCPGAAALRGVTPHGDLLCLWLHRRRCGRRRSSPSGHEPATQEFTRSEGARIADVRSEMISIAESWRHGKLQERVGGDLIERVLASLGKVLRQNRGQNVLLVCHSWVNKALIAHVTPGLGLQKLLDVPQRNCAVNVLDYCCEGTDAGSFQVLAVDLVAQSRGAARGNFRTDIVKDTLKHKELYPTIAFANRKSKVRIELIRSLMAMPSPRDPRLLRSDFSTCLTPEAVDSSGSRGLCGPSNKKSVYGS